MKQLLLIILTIFCCLSSNAQEEKKRQFKLPPSLTTHDYLPNKIIVKLRESASSQNKVQSVQSLFSELINIQKVQKKFTDPVQKNTNTISKKIDNYGLNRIYEITVADSVNIENAINELLSNNAVEYAEPVYIYRINYTPNDPSYTLNIQSYLNQVRAPAAWNLIRNTPSTIIAIVDSGSDLNHTDLAANIYHNENDPIDNKDNDGDGYVDNYNGWDFVGATGSNIIEDNNPNAAGSVGSHGIHVSGIASAVTDNSKGVASIAFNTAKLLIVKACADDNGTTVLRGYEGIKYAADHGAKIINCSWGGSASFFGQDIVNYAIAQGCLIVAAGGNADTSEPEYPAAYDGVLAVANVQNDDSKSPSSNYGYYISIAAPGTNIYSTIFNSDYGYNTGTSMSAPAVSSAAALVKAYRPDLITMQQVGEQLRATADNINTANPDYINQLGKGRLNVFRALTESPPSIKKQKITLADRGNGTIPAGDTLTIYVDLKNFLAPVNNLIVKLKSDNTNVKITQDQQTISSLGTLATKTNVGPFKVYINPAAPSNTSVEFKLEYTANTTGNTTYTDFEGFLITVARDYLNLSSSTIATTVTSIGRIGFIDAGNGSETLGFQYKNQQLLYEAALMIGTSASKVSDNARSGDDEANNHFVKKVSVTATQHADFVEGKAEFDDSGNPNRLPVYVKQRSIILKAPKNDKFLITEYNLTNTSNSVLTNVYIGLFTDWDINGGATNATEYDVANKIAYTYDKKDSSQPFGGVKLLNVASPAYYPLSNRIERNILIEDEFTTEEKYRTLSNGIYLPGLGTNLANGTDVSFVIGYGPYTIPPNSSVRASFALIGGDNLADIKATAQQAQSEYDLLNIDFPEENIKELALVSYPNPVTAANHTQSIEFLLPETKQITLELYNMEGQRVKTFIKDTVYPRGSYKQVYNLDGLASGVYFYRLNIDGESKTFKISIVK